MVEAAGIEPAVFACKANSLPLTNTPKDNMNTVTKECFYCKTLFNAPLKEVKRGHGKFCSHSCSSKYGQSLQQKPNPNVKCATCGALFYKNPSKRKLAKHGFYFCCRLHKDIAQRLGGIKEIQPPHYGNITSSYRQLALSKLPNKCNRCGYNKSISVLVVHHKDRNRNNCSITNLEILCPTHHMEEHYLAKDGLYNKRS